MISLLFIVLVFAAVWWFTRGSKKSRDLVIPDHTEETLSNEEAIRMYNSNWKEFSKCTILKPDSIDRRRVIDYIETWNDIYASNIVTPAVWYQLSQLASHNQNMESSVRRLGCQ